MKIWKLATGIGGALGLFAATIMLSSGTPANACTPGVVNLDKVPSITDAIDGYAGDQLQNVAAIMNAATGMGLTAQAQTIGRHDRHGRIQPPQPRPRRHRRARQPRPLPTTRQLGHPPRTDGPHHRSHPLLHPPRNRPRVADHGHVGGRARRARQRRSRALHPVLRPGGRCRRRAHQPRGRWRLRQHAQGDDYPWPDQKTIQQGGGLSPLGYYYRECTDFVAWRLNRDAGNTGATWKYRWSHLTPLGGDAIDWKKNWIAHDWGVSSDPTPGSVAYWGKKGGPQGHVAYVQSVDPAAGTVTIEEYNWGGKHSYDVRTIQSGVPEDYLSAPPR